MPTMIRTWKDADKAEQIIYRDVATNGNVIVYNNQVHYLVGGAADEEVALNYVIAHAPASYRDFPRTRISIDERRGPEEWIVTVAYGERDARGTDDSHEHDTSFGFATTGGTTLLREALNVTGSGGVQNPGFLLCPDADGNPQGLEVVSRALDFTVNKWLRPSAVTWAWIRKIAEYSGTINRDPWQGFKSGTLLFKGINGNRASLASDAWWQIPMEFSAAPEEQEKTITVLQPHWEQGEIEEEITLHLYGWQHLNVRTGNRYVPETVANDGNESGHDEAQPRKIRKVVVTGYSICDVYPKKDWSDLPI